MKVKDNPPDWLRDLAENLESRLYITDRKDRGPGELDDEDDYWGEDPGSESESGSGSGSGSESEPESGHGSGSGSGPSGSAWGSGQQTRDHQQRYEEMNYEVERWECSGLPGRKWRSVRTNVILFTPVVNLEAVPEGHDDTHKLPGVSMDPFEPFGRSLSHNLGRVQHVPFVSSVGMIWRHEDFIAAGDAIVVVTAHGPSFNENFVKKQFDFASDVWRVAANIKPKIRDKMILVHIGNSASLNTAPDIEYAKVLHKSTYDCAVAETLARKVFKYLQTLKVANFGDIEVKEKRRASQQYYHLV